MTMPSETAARLSSSPELINTSICPPSTAKPAATLRLFYRYHYLPESFRLLIPKHAQRELVS